jgi:hypothetical protein
VWIGRHFLMVTYAHDIGEPRNAYIGDCNFL